MNEESRKEAVLVSCEESQAVTIELRKLGVEAYSCDLLDCSGGYPEWHIKGGALGAIKSRDWSGIISFPPCTDISSSGSRHYAKKRVSGEQEASINFFLDIWEASNCVENPKNIMSGWKRKGSYLRRWFPGIVERMMDIGFPDRFTQSIQPYQFGHTETKETWLWLKGLPKLIPTHNVYEETMRLPYSQRAKVHCAPPSKDRGKLRSKTYAGIASAMASQWNKHLTKSPIQIQHTT